MTARAGKRGEALRAWLVFLYLGCIAWGTSFLWIKYALREIGPMTIVSYRLMFGVVTAAIVLAVSRYRVKFSGREFWLPMLMGVTGVAIPISLICYSETRIDSGLAGVLNATMPIWTMAIAHFALHDESFTFPKLAGMLSAVAGIYILMNPDFGKERDMIGQVAMISATLFYAATTVAQRKYLRGVHPFQSSLPLLVGGLVFITIAAAVFEAPFKFPTQPMTWLATGWMGVLGMGLATVGYFYLINNWGATKTSLVTFVFPPTAVLLGVVFLGEPLSWDIVAGGGLIIAGIALVNLRML